jgi:putative adhesin Stv-like protein
MAPLGVDPVALDSAGAEVVTAGEGLGSVISTLTTALSGCAEMAGDDPVGAALGHSYDSSAAKLFDAMAATRNGLCSLGDGVRMTAHNYSLAEAMSNISGHGSPLPTPSVIGPMLAGSPPSSVGTGDGAPPGWGWVAPYIGMIWPTGDSGKLRAAATAWNAAGTKFALVEILGTGGPMGAIRAQQIPEGPAIDRAFTDAFRSTTGLVQQCQKIADQLNSYAAKVDKVHAAILDLLSRICDPLTGIKEVWGILTGEDEDEIKKIADDIRTVIDNFSAEVDALRAQIAATLAEAVAIATTMGSCAERQWDQFLHGTEAGRAINQVGQYAKGMWSEAGGFVVGLWDISQGRLLVDPVGYYKDLGEMVQGALPLVGLGDQHAPSIEESWKRLGKSLVHWDEWQTNPAEAAGRSVFDIATLALPGGPLSKVGKAGRAAADALRGLRDVPEIPKLPSIEPPKTPPPPPVETPPPAPRPPEPRSPAPPPAKPAPGPANGPLPHSPTESKPPIGEKPPAGEPPKPTAAPPESAGKPPAVPVERTPLPHPQPNEAVPAALAPEPGPEAPAQAAPHVPALSAPHPQTPTPQVGAPHGGEPGVHPTEPHPPHDSSPHPPADGTPPYRPGDEGTPHPPDDGPPPKEDDHQAADSPDQTTPGGGDRHKISGHGTYDPNDGRFVVPNGSSITTYAKHGSTITDALGNLIETGGDTSGIYSQTFHAGESIPNYTIYPPDGLNISGSPQTVTRPTLVSELISENMGPVDLAVCTYDATCPTGKVYHVDGIYDEREGKFESYERFRP